MLNLDTAPTMFLDILAMNAAHLDFKGYSISYSAYTSILTISSSRLKGLNFNALQTLAM